MKKRLCLVVIALFAVSACDKKEEAKPEETKPVETAKPAPAAPAEKTVEVQLPKTGLKITLPESAKVEEGIIAGSDLIKFKGVRAGMVVKPRLITDKELSKLEPWAKGHQIQKFQNEVMKEGSGKTYTYMYNVDMSGMKQCVYHQMFQVEDKDYMCFSNADSPGAAKAMKQACDTITK